MNPGNNAAAPVSTTGAPGSAAVHSTTEPTATIRSPDTATACARGVLSSMVITVVAVSISSVMRSVSGTAQLWRFDWLDGVSLRGREELQGDAVGIAETQPRTVVGIHDAAVGDAQLVEALDPRLQLAS
jgi:hypothetical protein